MGGYVLMNNVELLINIYKYAALQAFFLPGTDLDDPQNKRIGNMIKAGMELEEKIKNQNGDVGE